MSDSSFTSGLATADRRWQIRQLNDELRKSGPGPGSDDRWMFTRGVDELGHAFLSSLVRSVRQFEAFDDGNDPHGEHDFGAVTIAGEGCFWKIDYYDKALEHGSSDPANASITTRVLTLMLASEY